MKQQLDRETAITQLLAKQDIRDVMMRYCRGVNRLDMELVRACFHEDAWENHGPYNGPAADFCAGLGEGLSKSFLFTFHFLGNSLIEFEGNRAASETYFVGYHRFPADGEGVEKDLLFGARYLGVHESRDGGPWLIADRTVVHDWSRLEPVVGHWPAADLFVQGKAGPGEDLVFHLLDKDRKAGAR